MMVFAKDLKIALIIPQAQNNNFWQLVENFSVAASEDLNIKLDLVHADNNRFAIKAAIQNLLNNGEKPDYLIFRPFSGNAQPLFQLLEDNKQKFVTLEQAHLDDDTTKLGQPGEQFTYWIGEVLYDNWQAGYLLADTLINMAPKKLRNINLLGFGGRRDFVSIQRNKGLIAAVEKHRNAHLHQVFTMHWDSSIVRKRFAKIASRYPDTNIIWSSSDIMAIEAKKQALKNKELAFTPIIGGIDWMPVALKKIAQGEIEASVGGHFLMGAQAIIKVIDYHNGLDRFRGENTKQKYSVITAKNVENYIYFIEHEYWKDIDYALFLHSQNNTHYEFTIEQLLIQTQSDKLNSPIN